MFRCAPKDFAVKDKCVKLGTSARSLIVGLQTGSSGRPGKVTARTDTRKTEAQVQSHTSIMTSGISRVARLRALGLRHSI
jgi:hypothetical protein